MHFPPAVPDLHCFYKKCSFAPPAIYGNVDITLWRHLPHSELVILCIRNSYTSICFILRILGCSCAGHSGILALLVYLIPSPLPFTAPCTYESHLRQICRVVVASSGGFICIPLLPGNGIQCSRVQFEIISTIAGPKGRQRWESLQASSVARIFARLL